MLYEIQVMFVVEEKNEWHWTGSCGWFAQWESQSDMSLSPSRQPGLTSTILNTHIHLLPLTEGFFLPVSQHTKCTLHNWLTHDCGPEVVQKWDRFSQQNTRVTRLHLSTVGFFFVSTPLLPCVGKLRHNSRSSPIWKRYNESNKLFKWVTW